MQYLLYTIIFDSCILNILCAFKNTFFLPGGAIFTAVIRVAEKAGGAGEQSAATAAGTDSSSGSGQRKRKTFITSGQPD